MEAWYSAAVLIDWGDSVGPALILIFIVANFFLIAGLRAKVLLASWLSAA